MASDFSKVALEHRGHEMIFPPQITFKISKQKEEKEKKNLILQVKLHWAFFHFFSLTN